MSSRATTLKLLIVENLPIFQQLQLEEALLRGDNQNWCIVNIGSPEAIVLGISSKVSELVDLKKVEQRPIPLIRRCSGGGTVVVDANTCFISFIGNSSDFKIKTCPKSIHEWVAAIYSSCLPQLPLVLKENDYAFEEKKYGGNAQYLCKERWLHHSSFLWDYDQKLMDYLLLPKKMPEYRQKREHHTFLGKLSHHLPSHQTFISSVTTYLTCFYELKKTSLEEALKFLSVPHRKATSLLACS